MSGLVERKNAVKRLVQKFAGLTACLSCLAFAHADDATLPASHGVTQVSATATSALTPANIIVLSYKFQPGQFVYYTGTSRVQYITQLGDQNRFSTLQTNETGTHFRVVTVDENGLALIEPVIDRTRMTAKMEGKETVEYDSAKAVDPQSQFRAIQDAIGRTVARFQVAPNGKLVKATVVDTTAPQALRDAAGKLDTRFPYLSLLPSTPVSVGDKWREDYSIVVINEGLKQPLPMRRVYELTAVANGIARISFKTVVLTPLNEAELEKQVIQQTPAGTIEFDIERGLVRSYTSNVDKTVLNAFGQQSLLNVTGKSTETLVSSDGDTVPPTGVADGSASGARN